MFWLYQTAMGLAVARGGAVVRAQEPVVVGDLQVAPAHQAIGWFLHMHAKVANNWLWEVWKAMVRQ